MKSPDLLAAARIWYNKIGRGIGDGPWEALPLRRRTELAAKVAQDFPLLLRDANGTAWFFGEQVPMVGENAPPRPFYCQDCGLKCAWAGTSHAPEVSVEPHWYCFGCAKLFPPREGDEPNKEGNERRAKITMGKIEIIDNGPNPLIVVSPEEVMKWLRAKADEAGYADRVTCGIQASFRGLEPPKCYWQIPELTIMVSNIKGDRK